MDERTELLENLNEFLSGARSEFKRGNCNSSATLYFKALATVGTLLVYEKYKILPKDHKERFSYLELIDKELVSLMKQVFSVYRRSYNLRLKRAEAEKVKNAVEEVVSERVPGIKKA
ncbi:MAG: hypothetical protein V1820_06655 [archaeon]